MWYMWLCSIYRLCDDYFYLTWPKGHRSYCHHLASVVVVSFFYLRRKNMAASTKKNECCLSIQMNDSGSWELLVLSSSFFWKVAQKMIHVRERKTTQFTSISYSETASDHKTNLSLSLGCCPLRQKLYIYCVWIWHFARDFVLDFVWFDWF